MDYKDDDLWLMQGDCLERMKRMPNGVVDLIVTDVEADEKYFEIAKGRILKGTV